MDEDNFERGMPKYMLKTLGQIQVGGTKIEESKRLRQIKSEISLSSNYFDCINEIVKNSFEKLATMEEPIDMLSIVKKPIFEVFMQILIGGGGNVHHKLLDETINLIRGCHDLPINIPGFAYNRAIKVNFCCLGIKFVSLFNSII